MLSTTLSHHLERTYRRRKPEKGAKKECCGRQERYAVGRIHSANGEGGGGGGGRVELKRKKMRGIKGKDEKEGKWKATSDEAKEEAEDKSWKEEPKA